MSCNKQPLSGIRVLEFAGLAPGPFAGKLLADFGAKVLRVDRHDSSENCPTSDPLAEHKRSIRVNLKNSNGIELISELSASSDVLIDPFRPGVLERLGLGPEALCSRNTRLIYARLAGFRRDGKYKDMAGHDINYLAVSGTLSLFGRANEKPYAPGNIVADFAGGGMTCFAGILLALLHRASSGKGQVVEANMVDGSAYLSLWPRLLKQEHSPLWDSPRGRNILDGGAPFYDTYRTKDGGYMAVGALEPAFYNTFLRLLLPNASNIPDRSDSQNWKELAGIFAARFQEKDRSEWESVFDGQDACVTPVKTLEELRQEGFERRAPVTLQHSPAIHNPGWAATHIYPGENCKLALEEWWELKEGTDWLVGDDGLARLHKMRPKI